jgi:AcrR family transcriptional regulator
MTVTVEEPGVRRRPGGRSERIRESVVAAVLQLFRERQFAFGVPDVAERAGVHRSTVYRRWPTRGELIAEALSSFFRVVSIPDTGAWNTDVHALAATLARFFSDPVEIGVVSALAADSDPQASQVIQGHWSPYVESMIAVVDRAKARGEVEPSLSSGRIVEMLTAPFVVRTTLVRIPVSRRQIREVADLVIRATTSAPEGQARPSARVVTRHDGRSE